MSPRRNDLGGEKDLEDLEDLGGEKPALTFPSSAIVNTVVSRAEVWPFNAEEDKTRKIFVCPRLGNNKEEKRRKIVLSRGNCKRGATHVKAGHRAVQRTFWMRSLSDDNACLTIS